MAETENLTGKRKLEVDVEEVAAPAPDQDGPVLSEREAYCNALRMWIHHAQFYQNLSNCFPYYMMTFQGLQNNQSNAPLLNNNYQFQGQQNPFQLPFLPRPAVPNQPRQEGPLNAADVINQHGGYEYTIPSLHKRVIAEMIDFVVLFVFKLILTLIAVDILNILDTSKFDLQKLSQNYEDYKYAIEITTEILYFELLFRVFVCIFEATCLSGDSRMSGATPGKSLMGLRVVTATAVIQVEGRERETVLLYPGAPLTFGTSLMRSIIKNFLISLLFPMCIVFFVFRFNRTGYDLLCGVIVVEENMYPPRRHAP